MSKRREVLYGVVLFLFGALCGVVGQRAIFKYHMRHGFEHGQMSKFLVKRLDRELDLSESQKASMTSLAEEVESKFTALRREGMPRVEGILNEAEIKAGAFLSDSQKEKLHNIRVKAQMRFSEKRE